MCVMETSGLSKAIDFMNEVRLRFRHEEGVYKCFLDVVNNYGKGLVAMNLVRVQVGALFEDHPDLLDRFLSFASSDSQVKKKKSVASVVEVVEKLGLKGSYDRGRLLFRKIRRVLGSSPFVEFLTHCRRYGSGEIERDDLNRLVAGVLRGHPGLLDEFDDFLGCSENAGGFLGGALGDKSPGTTTKKRKRSPQISDKPDFSKCQRVTPSYRLLPSSANLEDDHHHLLNDGRLACTADLNESENADYSSSRGRVKSEEEVRQDDYEDKRYEMDMLLASVTSATEAAEKLLNSENPVPIGECLSAMNLRCIEKLYGDRGIEIVHVLHQSPRDALPVIVPRLREKLEEVKEWARSFSF